MADLSGKYALITGAGSGIGAAIARTMHQHGAYVGLVGRRPEPLQALADSFGERADVFAADLADPQSAAGVASRAESAWGRIDVLVNNAGQAHDALVMRMSTDAWRDVMRVNLDVAFYVIRACLRGMVRRRDGRIINIASIVALSGNAGQANYAASKAGMIAMTKSIAREVAARGVCANCIAPGLVETPMVESLKPAHRAALLDQIPMRRIGTPADIAAGALFLASDSTRYITGETLHINGGMLMA